MLEEETKKENAIVESALRGLQSYKKALQTRDVALNAIFQKMANYHQNLVTNEERDFLLMTFAAFMLDEDRKKIDFVDKETSGIENAKTEETKVKKASQILKFFADAISREKQNG